MTPPQSHCGHCRTGSRLQVDASVPAGSNCGPGYRSPLDAVRHGPREKVLYIPCIQPSPQETQRSDYLATVDVDPSSATYSKVRCVLFLSPFTEIVELTANTKHCPEPLDSVQRVESPKWLSFC
jgi:hypothetical protein